MPNNNCVVGKTEEKPRFPMPLPCYYDTGYRVDEPIVAEDNLEEFDDPGLRGLSSATYQVVLFE
jgi:hypothetical protein